MPEILNKIARKAGSFVYGNQQNIIFERGLELDEESLSRRFDGELKLLRKDDVDITQFERYFSDDMKIIKHMFSLDLYCFAMIHDGDVVAQVWFADKDFYAGEVDFHFKVKPKELYEFFGIIHPKFRRTSISHDVLKFAWDYFRERGYEKVLCYVASWNVISLKLHRRLNFTDTGLRIRCQHFLWWKRSYLEDSSGNAVSQI